MLLAKAVCNVVVLLGETFDPPSHVSDWLFDYSQPLESAVVCTNLKLIAKNVAAKVAQRVDEREHFFASHCVFPLRLRQCTIEVRHKLFDFTFHHV